MFYLTIPSKVISKHRSQTVTDLKQSLLEDLKSTNGVYVGRKRVACHRLKEGAQSRDKQISRASS